MEIIESSTYKAWFVALRDMRAQVRIVARIRRLQEGNPGDVKPVGEGISEMRIDYGPGYRVYYLQHGRTTVLLATGGDKRTQDADVAEAKKIAAAWKTEQEKAQ